MNDDKFDEKREIISQLQEENKALREAIVKSISIADENDDSGISKPIREVLTKYPARGKE